MATSHVLQPIGPSRPKSGSSEVSGDSGWTHGGQDGRDPAQPPWLVDVTTAGVTETSITIHLAGGDDRRLTLLLNTGQELTDCVEPHSGGLG